MKAHFVTFLSPGTFVHEETTQPIKSWNIEDAAKMAKTIVEQYGATPFAFMFTTRERKPRQLDSQVVKQSGRYYLGGRVMTLGDVERDMPTEKILIDNMRGNRIERIVVNDNSWRCIQPLESNDVVLNIKEGDR